MLSIEELVNQVKVETLSYVIKKNRELVDMKYNDFESNVTFGRTFSLGQWFGYFLGFEVAKILNDHQVLIDTCLTTKKQYPTKSNPNNKRRKSYYPNFGACHAPKNLVSQDCSTWIRNQLIGIK